MLYGAPPCTPQPSPTFRSISSCWSRAWRCLHPILGGVAGYGTGALMPLVLVPMVGAEQVVPIIALAGMLTNLGRSLAFVRFIDWQRVRLVMAGAIPPCTLPPTAIRFSPARARNS